MDELALLHGYQTVGAMLVGIGIVGFLARRNMIVMFLALEMMLQGVSVTLVSWSRFHNDWGGQVLTVFIITVAACEAAIALALVLMLFRRAGGLDVLFWQQLRESNVEPFIEHELPEPPAEPADRWPHLPPAGIEPQTEEEWHRSHV